MAASAADAVRAGPYGQAPYGQAPPPPTRATRLAAPKKSKKGLIITLSVIGVLLIGAIVAAAFIFVALKDTTIATDMKLGDCITELPTDSVVTDAADGRLRRTARW